MSNTVRAVTPSLDLRTVQYDTANGSVNLNYTQMTTSFRNERGGRQNFRRIWRLTFQFVIAGESTTQLNEIITNCDRVLGSRGGTLTVSEGTDVLFSAAPAISPPQIAGPGRLDTGIRPTLLADVEWGPWGGDFNVIAYMGFAAVATWSVDVVTAAEDAFFVGDTCILGVDSEVTYSIDQNHYTTRLVVGRIMVANWGRRSATFERDGLSQADILPIRWGLLSASYNQGRAFLDPIRIPPNFERMMERFTVDNTENVLNFTIIDREQYRGYPAYMTSADMTISMSVTGATAIQLAKHVVTGYCEAPRDVNKLETVKAAWLMIQGGLPIITANTSKGTAFVNDFTFTNHAYRNRIEFSVTAYSSIATLDFVAGLGIGGDYKSEAFLPAMGIGSAGLFGSGYRLENQNVQRPTSGDTKLDPSETPTGSSAEIDQAKTVAASIPEALSFNLLATHSENNGMRAAIPSVKGANAISYAQNESDFKVRIICHASIVVAPGQTVQDFFKKFLGEVDAIDGVDIAYSKLNTLGWKQEAIKNRKCVKTVYFLDLILTGELRKKIIDGGGLGAFTASLNNDFLASSTFDNLAEAIKKFVAGSK